MKELSGFFASTDLGGLRGEAIGGIQPKEATAEDLDIAKLVLARFLPPIFFDTPELLSETLNSTLSTLLNVSIGPPTLHKKDNSKRKSPMTKTARKWIEQHNEMDIKLNDYALELVQNLI